VRIQSFDDLWNEINENPNRELFVIDCFRENLANFIFLALNDLKQLKNHLKNFVLIHLFFFVII